MTIKWEVEVNVSTGWTFETAGWAVWAFSNAVLMTSMWGVTNFLFCTINYIMETSKDALYIKVIFWISKWRINLKQLDFIPEWNFCEFLWWEKSELGSKETRPIGLISEVKVKLQMEKLTITTPKHLPWCPLNRCAILKLVSEAITTRTFLWRDAWHLSFYIAIFRYKNT